MSNISVENRLKQLFDERTGNSRLDNVLGDLRMGAIATVVLQGIPSKKAENYRYTDIRAIYESQQSVVSCAQADNGCQTECLPVESECFKMCNGCMVSHQKLVETQQGVILGSLAEAADRYPYLVGEYLNRATDSKNTIEAINTAFVQDGFFLYVPKNVELEQHISIRDSYCAANSAMTFSRALVIMEPNAKATVIFDTHSECENQMANNSLREFFVKDGAKLNIIDIQRVSNSSANICSTEVLQGQDSQVKSVSLTLDGGVVRNDWRVKLNGRGADNKTLGLALSGENQHIDYYTDIEHLSSDATSQQKFKSTAAANGQVVFNGRIYVAQDAQRTQAFQENRNLLLSDTANIYAKPQLEIYADDVKCSHGATVGQLNAEEIYYMRQRGISEVDAKRLQVYGFFNEIISQVADENLVEYLNKLAESKIERL